MERALIMGKLSSHAKTLLLLEVQVSRLIFLTKVSNLLTKHAKDSSKWMYYDSLKGNMMCMVPWIVYDLSTLGKSLKYALCL